MADEEYTGQLPLSPFGGGLSAPNDQDEDPVVKRWEEESRGSGRPAQVPQQDAPEPGSSQLARELDDAGVFQQEEAAQAARLRAELEEAIKRSSASAPQQPAPAPKAETRQAPSTQIRRGTRENPFDEMDGGPAQPGDFITLNGQLNVVTGSGVNRRLVPIGDAAPQAPARVGIAPPPQPDDTSWLSRWLTTDPVPGLASAPENAVGPAGMLTGGDIYEAGRWLAQGGRQTGRGVFFQGPSTIPMGVATVQSAAENAGQAARLQRLAGLDAIDRGETFRVRPPTVPAPRFGPDGEPLPQQPLAPLTHLERQTQEFVSLYQAADPDARRRMRAELQAEINAFTPTPVQERLGYLAGEWLQRTGRELVPHLEGFDEQSIATQLGLGLGSMGVGLVASAFTGPAGGLMVFGSMGIGEATQRAVEFDRRERAAGRRGLTQDEIILAGLWGVAPGTTDSIPVEGLLGRLPIFNRIPRALLTPLSRFIARVGGQAFIEGFQEGGQEFLQNVIALSVYDPNQKLLDGVLPSAGVGAGVGAISETGFSLSRALASLVGGRRGGGRGGPAPSPEAAPETPPQQAPQQPVAPAPAAPEAVAPPQPEGAQPPPSTFGFEDLPAPPQPEQRQETVAPPQAGVAPEQAPAPSVEPTAPPAPSQEAPAEREKLTRLPRFEDVTARLPVDAEGFPDVAGLQQRMQQQYGVSSWQELNLPQRVELFRQLGVEARQRQAEVPPQTTALPPTPAGPEGQLATAIDRIVQEMPQDEIADAQGMAQRFAPEAAAEATRLVESILPQWRQQFEAALLRNSAPQEDVVRLVNESVQIIGAEIQRAGGPATLEELRRYAHEEGQRAAIDAIDAQGATAGQAPVTASITGPIPRAGAGAAATTGAGPVAGTPAAAGRGAAGTAAAAGGGTATAAGTAAGPTAAPARTAAGGLAAPATGGAPRAPAQPAGAQRAGAAPSGPGGERAGPGTQAQAERVGGAQRDVRDERGAGATAAVEAPPRARRYTGPPLSDDEINVIVDNWKYVREVFARPKPVSLTAYIVASGGIEEFRGELSSIAGGVRGRPGLIRRSREDAPGLAGLGAREVSGRSIDDWTQKAWDAGYFPYHTERPTIQELLDKIRDDLHTGREVAEGDESYFEDVAIATEMETELGDYGITTRDFRKEETLRAYLGQQRAGAAGETAGAEGAQAADVRGEPAAAEPVTEPTPDQRSKFRSLLASRQPPNWSSIGATPEQLQALQQEAVQEGLLRLDRNGSYRRTPQASIAPTGTAELSISPEDRVEGAINALGRQVSPAVRTYAVELLTRLGSPSFMATFNRAKAELKVHDARDLAAIAGTPVAARAKKDTAFSSIEKRHQDHKAFLERQAVDANVTMSLASFQSASEEGASQAREFDTLGYYSRALEAAKAWPQKKGAPQQVIAHLKKAGVKDIEIEATNLNSFLEGKKSVTRDELVSFLRENRVEVREARYGGGRFQTTDEFWDEVERLERAGRTGEAQDLEARMSELIAPATHWRPNSLAKDDSNPTYRETVLHLPDATAVEAEETALRARLATLTPGTAAYAATWDALSRTSSQRTIATTTTFRSGHFPEPNVVSNIMSSLNKLGDKTTYAVSQVQSDWSQKIRDATRDALAMQMFGPNSPATKARIAELQQHLADVQARLAAIPRDQQEKPEGTYSDVEQIPYGYRRPVTDEVAALLRDQSITQGEITNLQTITGFQSLSKEQRSQVSAAISEARAKGELPAGARDEKKIAALKKQLAEATAELDKASEAAKANLKAKGIYKGPGYASSAAYHRSINGKVYVVDSSDPASKAAADRAELLGAELRTAEAATPPHPLVNTTDAWLNLTLKHIVRQAIASGADSISIPSGATVLDYNPQGSQEGNAEFYDRIVPIALGKILKDMDKSIKPYKVDHVQSPVNGSNLGSGFTVFPLTQKVKDAVQTEGMALMALAGGPFTPGLDMSPEAIKARAEALGFDTSTVYYHGTYQVFEEFEARNETGGPNAVYVTPDKAFANLFAVGGNDSRVYALWIRKRNFADLSNNDHLNRIAAALKRRVGGGISQDEALSRIKSKIADNRLDWEDRDAVSAVRDAGFNGVHLNDFYAPSFAVFDPSNIRSVNAAFDPAQEGSSALLAAIQQRGFGLTPSDYTGSYTQAPAAQAVPDAPQYTDPFLASRTELAARIERWAREMLPPEVATRVVDRITTGTETAYANYGFSETRYGIFDRVVQIALTTDAGATSYRTMLLKGFHEIVHALREHGRVPGGIFGTLLTSQEWQVTLEGAKKFGIDDHITVYDYTTGKTIPGIPIYRRVYRKMLRDAGFTGNIDQRVEELIDQERVARFAEIWAEGTSFGTKIDSWFERLVQFVEAVRNALRGLGFHTYNDVYKAMASGEVARRASPQYDASLGPDQIPSYDRNRFFPDTPSPEEIHLSSEEGQVARGLFPAIRAFHGSPHDFDRFDITRIGTGEGAQAFGFGLYFAESEGVAQSYKTSVTRNTEQLAEIARSHGLTGDGAEMLAHQFATGFGGQRFNDWVDGLRDALEDPLYTGRSREAAQQIVDKLVEASTAVSQMKAPGRLYEVSLDVESEQLLDWDKPLSEQSESLRRALWERSPYYVGDDMTGRQLYLLIDAAVGPMEAGRVLKEAGIPGIRYLDQGSRTAGEGSRNFVIFDDSLVKIVAKDGKPVEAEERADVLEQMHAEQEGGEPGGSGMELYSLASGGPATPGLDMSPEARKARAEAMGFDTSTVWYHGTDITFDSFRPSSSGELGPGVYLTPDEQTARAFGAKALALYVRGRIATAQEFNAAWDRHFGQGLTAAQMYDRAGQDLRDAGYVGAISRFGGQAVVWDPSNIRSVDAAFDPAQESSSQLLASFASSRPAPETRTLDTFSIPGFSATVTETVKEGGERLRTYAVSPLAEETAGGQDLSMTKEYPVRTAIRMHGFGNRIFSGDGEHAAVAKMAYRAFEQEGNEAAMDAVIYDDDGFQYDNGFITNKGRFVGREEAYHLARGAGLFPTMYEEWQWLDSTQLPDILEAARKAGLDDASAPNRGSLSLEGTPSTSLIVSEQPDGGWELSFFKADPATLPRLPAIVAEIEANDLGKPISPRGWITPEGYAYWQQQNPEAVRWHQNAGELFGGAYASPRAIEHGEAILADAAKSPNATPQELERIEAQLTQLRRLKSSLPPRVFEEARLEEAMEKRKDQGLAALASSGEGGLDMSPEARKARAEAMGFDTSTVYYHGTDRDFAAFRPSAGGGGPNAVYLTTDPTFANLFVEARTGHIDGTNGRILPLWVRRSQFADITSEADLDAIAVALSKRVPRLSPEQARQQVVNRISNGRLDWAYRDAVAAVRDAGFAGIDLNDSYGPSVAVFDPSNIRSVNAAFDPAQEGSPMLLASFQGQGTPPPGGPPQGQPSLPITPATPGAPRGIADIIADLKSALSLPVTQGLYGMQVRDRTSGRRWSFRPQRNVRGQYDATSGVARIRVATDIDAIAQQGGRHVVQVFGAPMQAFLQQHAEELAMPAAPDAPLPAAIAPTGFSGIELDADTQRVLAEAGAASLAWRAAAAAAPATGPQRGSGRTAGRIYELAAAAAVANNTLRRRLGRTIARALVADIIGDAPLAPGAAGGAVAPTVPRVPAPGAGPVGAIAPASVASYVQDRYSATGTPAPRQTPTVPAAELSDAFANFFQRFITDPDGAKRDMPGVFVGLEDFLDANDPALLEDIEAVQLEVLSEDYKAYQQATAWQQAQADSASMQPETAWQRIQEWYRVGNTFGGRWDLLKQWIGWTGSSISYTGIDATNTILKSQQTLLRLYNEAGIRDPNGRPIALRPSQDAHRIARMMAGADKIGHQFITHGVPDYQGLTPIGPSLHDALVLAFGGARSWQWSKQAIKRFGTYLEARRAVAEWPRFLAGEIAQPTRRDLLQNQAIIAEAEAANPNYRQAAQMVYDWQHRLLTHEWQAGKWTDEAYQELSKRKDFYVPFMRDMSDYTTPRGFGNRMARRFTASKRFEGSQRDIINPIESMVKRAYEAAASVQFNDMVKALVTTAEGVPGGGKIAERLTKEELLPANQRSFELIRERLINDLGMDPADAYFAVQNMEHSFTDTNIEVLANPDNLGPLRPPLVPLWENGERKLVRLNDPVMGARLYDAMNALGREQAGILTRIISWPAGVLRAGVTMNPTYVVGNILADMVGTFTLVGNVMHPASWPVITQARGTWHLISTNPTAAAIMRSIGITPSRFAELYSTVGGISGAQNTAAINALGRDYDIASLRQRGFSVFNLPSMGGLFSVAAGGVAGGLLAGPVGATLGMSVGAMGARAVLGKGAGRFFAAISEASETVTRLGAASYVAARVRRQYPHLSDIDVIRESSFTAQDVLDFNRSGAKAGTILKQIPFLNSSIQGVSKAYRQSLLLDGDRGRINMRKIRLFLRYQLTRSNAARAALSHEVSEREEQHLLDGARAFINMAILIVVGMALHLAFKDDPEYADVRHEVRDTHFVFKLFGTWYRVKKPFELAQPANMAEAFYDWMWGNDPNLMQRIRRSFLETHMPPMVPQIYNIMTGWWTGVDPGRPFSRSPRQIIPEGLERLPPHLQYTALSSAFARAWSETLSKVGINISPMMIDWTLNNELAYWGREIRVTSDYIWSPRAPQWTEMPIIGTMLNRFRVVPGRGSASIEEFWALMGRGRGELDQAQAGYDRMLKSGNPDAAMAYLAGLSREEVVYSVLQRHFSSLDKRAHPMNRVKAITDINRAMRREMTEPGGLISTDAASRGRAIPLTPTQRAQVDDVLGRLSALEAWNALHAIGRPGWATREVRDPQPLLDELRAMSQPAYDEMMRRRRAGHIGTHQEDARRWTDVERRVEQMIRDQNMLGLAWDRAFSRRRVPTRRMEAPSGEFQPLPQFSPAPQ